MKELLAAIVSEDESQGTSLALRLDDQADLAPRLDKLLSMLVQARAAMEPPVQGDPPKAGRQVRPIVKSGWQVDPTISSDTILLSLHHPALGWLTWALLASEATALANGLLGVLASEASVPTQLQ